MWPSQQTNQITQSAQQANAVADEEEKEARIARNRQLFEQKFPMNPQLAARAGGAKQG